MRAQEFGTSPKRPAREGSRPERGHKEQPRYKNGISADQENKFHVKLDKLVHNTFGHSSAEIEEERNEAPSDPLANREAYAKKHKQGQVYKKTYPGDKHGMTKAYAYDIKRTGPKGHLPEELDESKTVKQQPQKPRNFVAKNAINTGAGAHKDKKKAEKQGDVKHKGKAYDLAETWMDIEEWLSEEGKASRRLCKSGIPDKDLGASQLASCKSQGLRARDGEKSHLIGHGNSSVRITVGGKKIKGKKYGGPLPDYGTRKNQK